MSFCCLGELEEGVNLDLSFASFLKINTNICWEKISALQINTESALWSSLWLFLKPEKSATKQAQCIVLPNPGPLCKYFPSSSPPLDVTQWHRRSSQFCSQAQEGLFIVLRASFNFTISNCYFLFVCLFPNTNKQFWSQICLRDPKGLLVNSKVIWLSFILWRNSSAALIFYF